MCPFRRASPMCCRALYCAAARPSRDAMPCRAHLPIFKSRARVPKRLRTPFWCRFSRLRDLGSGFSEDPRPIVSLILDRPAADMSQRSYYVYVIALSPDVLQNTRFRRRNPGLSNPAACLYVGSSAHPPERRFEQHLNGYKANRFVRQYGVELQPSLYDKYNPIDSRTDAEHLERYLAERLQSRGYAVWTG